MYEDLAKAIFFYGILFPFIIPLIFSVLIGVLLIESKREKIKNLMYFAPVVAVVIYLMTGRLFFGDSSFIAIASISSFFSFIVSIFALNFIFRRQPKK